MGNISANSEDEAETGSPAGFRRLMRSLYEKREIFYRLPMMRSLVRYLYWHVFRMNEYVRVFAVRTN